MRAHGSGQAPKAKVRSLALAVCAVVLAETSACGLLSPNDVKPDPDHPVLAIGSPAPDFSLAGADGKTHGLKEYGDTRVLAIVFQCNHCPASELYEGRINKLYKDYRNKGVAVVAINPNNPNSVRMEELAYTDVNDSLAGMKIRAADRHLDYPYLYDGETQAVSAKFGVVATPHIFVFDRDRKLRYRGRLDDNQREDLVKSQDARNAIEALLAGKPVGAAETGVSGCATKWLSKPSGRETETAKIGSETVSLDPATPDVLKKLRANATGKLLLVNFWATWCGPCVAEFPDLQDTYRMYRGRNFGLVTVSSNEPEARPEVLDFLRKQHASSTNFLFASADTYALQDAFDPKMGGAVPFSLLLAPNGDVLYQEQGELSIMRLRRAILANLPDDKEHAGMQAYWSAN